MSLFLIILVIYVHWAIIIADFFNSELDPTNLKNVTLLNLVVLLNILDVRFHFSVCRGTYDLLIVDFQTTDDKIHAFLRLCFSSIY